MIPFGDLARQSAALQPELDEAIAGVVARGRYLFGPELEAFEAAFASWCGAGDAVGVSSGTDAITVALQAVGVGEGDEVITVANTCVPTIVGIENAGATAVLVDPDPVTRTIDVDAAASAVTQRTAAILPVHLYGQCADVDALLRLCEQRGLALVEDCAQSHGAEAGGRRAGSFGRAAAFSFYPTKNLGALGDAGAVVTSDREVAERARLLRNYGERERYEHVLRGWNSRLDAVQAAVLSTKLPHVDAWNERRREIAGRYDDALRDTSLRLPQEAAGTRHVYHLYVVEAEDRDGFRKRLRSAGVESGVHYPRAIHEQPVYRALGDGRSLPVSERLAATVVSLPIYPELTDDEVERVGAAAVAAA